MNKKLTTLIIMDGFGVPTNLNQSGIVEENTVNLRALKEKYSYATLRASEEYVGLPTGQAGTSEVGHMTIGSGRVTYQPLVRINREIENKEFFKNETLCWAIDEAKKNNKALHLVGMPSDGGIHSHINHLFALLDLCKQKDFKDVYVHFICDGRDTPPKSAKKYIKQVEDYIKTCGVGILSTIIGRFYALDRDKNWDRNKIAYDCWVDGVGNQVENWEDGIDQAYNNGETDEFVKPIVLTKNGEPIVKIQKEDVVISYNFRADRERQLAYVMVEDNDLDFVKDLQLKFITMTEYDENFKKVYIAYKTETSNNILSEVLSNNGLKQVKIAETEKYAHLTFFFNSGKQDTYEGEDRILINSEKMASYANKPEMSAEKITEKALEAIENDQYDFIAINFANCDMVGHSGVKEAANKATKVVDECVKRVVDAVLKKGGQGIVTADHGNADMMQYEDGSPNTAHTTAIVPFILFDAENPKKNLREQGSLADIAPTLLKMLDIAIPEEMTGKPMF
ncbi:MAG: 2,3-bisphosphoglycerate-independent phosphoglycerate mutase [Clostridia bacterium]|nr:2,3-bisphosphoglycerate-independent phosphoglycerate mutase [Clostridia bacterium]